MRPPSITALLTGTLLAAAALSGSALSAQEVREGTLLATDPLLGDDSGRVADSYEVEIEAGRFVTMALRSGEFDAFLRVVSPAGVVFENDDGDGTDSELEFLAVESGVWTVHATGFSEDDFGSYTLTWTTDAASGDVQTVTGRLSSLSPKGQPYDSVMVDLGAGTVVFQLTNGADAYLTLLAEGPDGRRQDVYPEPGTTRLTFRGATAGTWALWVAAEEGAAAQNLAYSLSAVVVDGSPAEVIEGRLESTDPRLPLGEFADRLEIEVDGEGPVVIDLASDDFDTYLVVETAGGAPIVKRNDDADGGGVAMSSVEFTAAEVAGRTGTWTVWVTSFGRDQTGDWTLRISR